MKKSLIFLTSLLTLTLSLCACGTDTTSELSVPSEPAEEELAEEIEESSGDFGTILDNYCLAYTENWSNEQMREGQVSCFKTQEEGASIEDFGFSIMDLDGDGFNELVIGLLNGTAEEPLCGIYYNIEGDNSAYGVSYTDGYEVPDGMYPSFVQYYAVLNADTGAYNLLKVTEADGETEAVEETDSEIEAAEETETFANPSYQYELEVIESGCSSMLEILIPNAGHQDGSFGWTLNKEDNSEASSTEAWAVTDLTDEEAGNYVKNWMSSVLIPEYHPLTDWVENPDPEAYID